MVYSISAAEREYREMQSDRLKDEIFGGFAVCDHLPCRTCLYAYAGDPENSYCKIYTEEIGLM